MLLHLFSPLKLGASKWPEKKGGGGEGIGEGEKKEREGEEIRRRRIFLSAVATRFSIKRGREEGDRSRLKRKEGEGKVENFSFLSSLLLPKKGKKRGGDTRT